MSRTKQIVKTSIVGIIANIFLAGFKAFVGALTSSVAITLDAVNNLSDALSSIITIVGAKLADKEPDKKHPFGYGRIEYLSAMVIGFIILYAGITSFIESIQKILKPVTPEYGAVSLIIITVAIFVKVFLGLYTKKNGEKLNSDSLIASGKDALNDSLISSSTLLAAIIFILTGVSIEAFVGILISILIIKTGFESLHETVSATLGERIPSDISKAIKQSITSFPEIEGAYDLVVHNYGKETLIGSVHIQVPQTLTALELDSLERKVVEKVFLDTGVSITGISIYSANINDNEAIEIKKKIVEIIGEYQYILQMHGFFKDDERKMLKFDIVIDYDAPQKKALRDEVSKRVKELYPEYDNYISIDYAVSD